MKKLVFNGSKHSVRRLSKAQKSIDRFLKRHPSELSKHGHRTLKKLFSKRAKALSKATGMKVH